MLKTLLFSELLISTTTPLNLRGNIYNRPCERHTLTDRLACRLGTIGPKEGTFTGILLHVLTAKQLVNMKTNAYRPRHYPFVTDVGHVAWTFVLGPFSGPRRIRTRPDAEGLHTLGPDVNVFPENCAVARLAFTVKDKPYLIYFDRERHVHDRDNATYVFLRLGPDGRIACNFSVERDFPDILYLWKV